MSDLFTSADARAVARRTDPQTSHDAADSVRRIRQSQQEVLEVLTLLGPLTDEEIFDALCCRGVRMSPSGARTRRRELCDSGYVVDSGRRKLTKARRHTIVWDLPTGL